MKEDEVFSPVWRRLVGLETLPKSPAVWLLGACLFFVPLSSLRVVSNVSISDVLFVLAVITAVIEHLRAKDSLVSLTVWKLCFAYTLVALLLLVSYLGHELGLAEFSRWAGAHAYLGGLALPENSKVLAGAVGDGDRGFIILLACLVFIPISLLLIPIKDVNEVKFLIYCLAGGALWGAIFTILFCNGFWVDHYDWSWKFLGRARGLTPHPNILGHSSLMALPGLYLIFTASPHWVSKACAVVGLGVVWQAVEYSGSRSALASCVVILALIWILSPSTWPRRMSRGFLMVCSAVLTVLFASSLAAVIDRGTSQALWRLLNGSTASDSARDVINSVALDQAYQSPFFGVGYDVLKVAHNLYLQMFHMAGLLGLLAFLISTLVPLFLLIFSLNKRYGGEPTVPLAALSASYVIFAVVNNNPAEISTGLIFGLALLVAKEGVLRDQRS